MFFAPPVERHDAVRTVEVLVAWADGTWTTMDVEIPAGTPEEELRMTAELAALQALAQRGDVVLTTTYNIPERVAHVCPICGYATYAGHEVCGWVSGNAWDPKF